MNELYHYGVKGMKWGVRHDKDKGARRIEKTEKYKGKLVKRAERRSKKYRSRARDVREEIDDINKKGLASKYWQDYSRNKSEATKMYATARNRNAGMSEYDAKFWGSMSGGAQYLSTFFSTNERNQYIKDLEEEHAHYIRTARRYTSNRRKLMNYPVNETTKRRDVRKVYRKNLKIGE